MPSTAPARSAATPAARSVVGATSTTGKLINNANLALGTNNVTVSADYSNANFGTGNAFNKHAGVTGTGQILASGNAAQAVTGATVTNGTSGTPTLTIGNVRVGGTTLQLPGREQRHDRAGDPRRDPDVGQRRQHHRRAAVGQRRHGGQLRPGRRPARTAATSA